MNFPYYDWAARLASLNPEKIAIVDLASQRELSYRTLNDRASRLASHLQQAGLEKGDRVAILAPNGPEFFELEFACGKIGTIAVPLNWRLTQTELTYILNDCSPKVLIYDLTFKAVAHGLQSTCGIAQLLEIEFQSSHSSYEQALKNAEAPVVPEPLTLDDLVMIMYTSGTTGHPKGAMINHGMQFINCVHQSMSALLSHQTVQLVMLPLFHSGGLNCYANPVLHTGGKILIMREFDAGQALTAMNNPDYGITHIFAVPAPYQFMLAHPDFATTDLSRVKIAGIGGAPSSEALLKGWMDRGVSMVQGWGMTETSPAGSSLSQENALRKIGSAGKAVFHTEIKIVDEAGGEVNPGEVGELLIRGPNVTPGYWNNPEATRDSFIDGWLKTGDAARFDDEGFIYIVDRWKDMYISGGENVYPAEVENIIYELPEIVEAAVIGVPSERWGETGKAVLVLKPGAKLSEEAVIQHCLTKLAKFKIPQSVEFIEALPRNATGKVLKRTLREQFLGADAPAIS